MQKYLTSYSTRLPVALALVGLVLGFTLVLWAASPRTANAAGEPITVTINKVIDGVAATAATASSTDFSMFATYTIGGTDGGPSPYALSASGYNGDPTPYQAKTSGLSTGDTYATHEDTTGGNVGTACSVSEPSSPHFALVGYSTGNTYAEALAATPTLTAPHFPHLEHNKFVVVWNHDCTLVTPPSLVTVTITKFIEGTVATAGTASSSDFGMNATWNATNIGAGTGNYILGTSNTPNAYQTKTADMSSGANYATNELMDGVVGNTCSTTNSTSPRFALLGYTTGDTEAQAMAGSLSSTAPAFTGMTSDKFVIVWNHDCKITSGQIGGTVTGGATGSLAVTSIDAVDTSAIADGTFANGWKYVFNITIPTNETNVAMKFADWIKTVGVGTIPVANALRISSAQANNAGATILITAANTYSSPDLHMTGDLSTSTPGLQVQITVEAAVAVGTLDGSYTTSYGVRSL